MPINREIEIYLWRAQCTHNLIIELFPTGSYEGSIRNRFFHALCDLSLEHLGSIINLVDTGKHLSIAPQHQGSALALLRPLIETVVRAAWTLYVAEEDLIVTIAQAKAGFPGISKATGLVSAHLEKMTGKPELFHLNPGFLSQLHGLTHSGVEQIAGRFGPNLEIRASYPDLLITRLLDQASRWAVTGALLQIQQVYDSQELVAKHAEILTTRFLAIFADEPLVD